MTNRNPAALTTPHPATEPFPTPESVQRTIPPATLYLIRHGEPHPDYLDRFYGDLDIELSERGRRQSRDLAERLADVPFDAVYSSDLQRAGYLADRLAEPRDLPVRRLQVFRERSMGVMQNRTIEQMQREDPALLAQWRADRVHFRPPEGISFVDLRDRVVPGILELAAAFMGRRVALACHGGPIRVVVAHALGMPLENVFRLSVNYCGIFVIEFPRDDPPKVTLMNG